MPSWRGFRVRRKLPDRNPVARVTPAFEFKHVMGAAGRLSQENAVLRDLIHQFLGEVRAL